MPRAPKIPKLSYLKCAQCRKDRQKCEPVTRKWPQEKCERCIKYHYVCSESRTKTEETKASKAIDPKAGEILPAAPAAETTPAATETTPSVESTPIATTAPGASSVAVVAPTSIAAPATTIEQGWAKPTQQLTEELGYLGQLWQALQQKYNDKRRYCGPGERDLYSREVADVSNLICELEKAYEVTKSEATVHMQNLISSGSYYEADTIRQRILRGLQPIVLPEDATLLELKNAVSVYEKLSDFLATEKYQEKLALITLTAPKVPNDLEAAKVVKLIEIYELSKIRSPGIAKRLKLDPKSCAKASPILHRAALLNNKTILLAVTSRGIRISEIFDCGGRTPVHIAAQANATDALSFFKDGHYPWLLDVDLFRRTPLVTAARSGSLEAFEFLLKVYLECANLAMLLNDCAQALQVASQLGHQEIVRILLRRFTSTEFQSHNDSLGKALFLASVGNHPELVMILLEAGASVNSSTGAHIYNPLRGASKYGNVAIVHILLGRVVKGGNLPDTSIIKSSLHLASLGGHLQTVRLLLDAGAKKLNRYEYENILKMASACGYLEVARLLLEASDFTTPPLDGSDSALLRWVPEWGNQEEIRALFDKGIHHNATRGDNAYGRPYCKSNEGPIDYGWETAFGLASKQGHLDVVKLLFDRNTSISYITALKDALKSCKPELAKMIFEYGAGASAWSSITAAIQGAARIGHHEIVLAPLEGCDNKIDFRCQRGMDHGCWQMDEVPRGRSTSNCSRGRA